MKDEFPKSRDLWCPWRWNISSEKAKLDFLSEHGPAMRPSSSSPTETAADDEPVSYAVGHLMVMPYRADLPL
jgi:hypothetical protein